MQVQVTTRLRLTTRGAPEIVLRAILLPRGSGNRNRARDLAKGFKQHPQLKPFVKHIVTGSSSVTVHLRSCFALASVINDIAREAHENPDVPGQLPLFT